MRLKSEEVPEDQNEAVQTLVGKNFEQIVYDTSKDVLVMFHSPKCQHCQLFMPIMDKVAEFLNLGTDDIILAKIDGTVNDVKGHDVNSFPTIKFFPRNNKKNPILFEG
jgi:thioredoxin-like negative regulator of GroEL